MSDRARWVREMGAAGLVELAEAEGVELVAESVRFEEAGLDYRVAFARGADGVDWVLRVPRRPDVSQKLAEERRILAFVADRVSVAVPRWQVCSERLVAYRRLPGAPGLTLDAGGQPVWHYDPSSPEFARALGRLIAELQRLDAGAAREAGVPALGMNEGRAKWRAGLARVAESFAIAPALEERWQRWLADDGLWPDENAFTHGELYAAHVLIAAPERPGDIVGVLDWTTAKVGDPASDFVYQHMMGEAAFESTVRAYLEAGGAPRARLAERCGEIAAASPIAYGVFALESGDPQHRASAAAMLDPG